MLLDLFHSFHSNWKTVGVNKNRLFLVLLGVFLCLRGVISCVSFNLFYAHFEVSHQKSNMGNTKFKKSSDLQIFFTVTSSDLYTKWKNNHLFSEVMLHIQM